MRVVNEKGRIFGKINLLDLVIIGFVIFAIGFICINTAFGGKLFKKISDVPEFEYAVIDVILPADSTWMKEYINIGDVVEGSSFRGLTATVLEVKEVEGYGPTKRLAVKIKTYAAKTQGILSLGKHPLRIGEEIPFFTPGYIFNGRVVNIEMTGEKIHLKD